MDLTFGARLRLQRERQQVALTTIAEDTKISVALLEGLERDDVSRWPGGLFRRAFIRGYAQAIGLEPEAIVREFLEIHPDPDEASSPVVAMAESAADSGPRRPPTRLGFLIAGLASFRPARETASRAVARDEAAGRAVVKDEAAVDDRTPGPEQSESAGASAPASVPEVVTTIAFYEASRRQIGPKPATPPKVVSADTNTATRSSTVSLERDLVSVARLCTTLGCACDQQDVAGVLEEAARILEAQGVILWVWDPRRATLCPALACGYADETLAALPRVDRTTDNAIAAAFRSAQVRVVDGTLGTTGAFVAPLLTPNGCVGALALEFGNGGEERESVRALATILSAQLSTLVAATPFAQAVSA